MPTDRTPRVTVAVCTRDRPGHLAACLDALAKLTYWSFEILVVDNGSVGSTTRKVADSRGVRYVMEPNTGLSRARNRAARESTADIIAYIDDDATPEPGWLDALVGPFHEPEVMAVGGQVYPLSPYTGS